MPAAGMQNFSERKRENGRAIVSDAGVGGEARGQIPPANPADGPAMAKVAAASPGAPSWPKEAYKQFKQSGYHGWVVEQAGVIAGFLVVRITADEAEILNLAVMPEHRRRRCATILVHTALRELHAKAVRQVFLEVRESNSVAIRFYESCGFRLVRVRPDYYREPQEAAVCMGLKFTGAAKA